MYTFTIYYLSEGTNGKSRSHAAVKHPSLLAYILHRVAKSKPKNSRHLVRHACGVDDTVLSLGDAGNAVGGAVDILGIPKEVGLAVGGDTGHQGEGVIHVEVLQERPNRFFGVLVGVVRAEEGAAEPSAVTTGWELLSTWVIFCIIHFLPKRIDGGD